MIRRIALLALLVLAAPTASSAQSLFIGAGLGVPTDPLDARARALGGVGIGLHGPALLGSDPAAAASFLLPTLIMTAQPSWVDYGRDSGDAGTFRGTRFPNVGIAYPVFRVGVVTLSLESFLDQRYQARRSVTLDLGEGPVEATDRFLSNGGVSQVRVGFARPVGERLRVGVSAGAFTGSVTRRLERLFFEDSDTTASTQVERYQAGGLWGYSGNSVTGGASLSLGTFAEVAGSVTWSSALDATPSDDTDGAARSFDLPLTVRLGATADLAPGLSLSAGYTRADWSVVDDDLMEGASAGTTNSLGVGVELSRARLFGRQAPLRLGYRKTDLPFALGAGSASEKVWAGGIGLNLSQIGELVRAGVDLALERGDRSDTTLSESFWRATLTVKVAGF
ncbi:MAG TPA: hypothetical protein VLA36_05950 [Longimicrobiales bacterium]|nr:hypothetical protein [Longimicrobiales bacterium]